MHALHGELHALHAFFPALPVDSGDARRPAGRQHAVRTARCERAARRELDRAVDGFDVKRSHRHLVEGRPNEAIPRAAKRERSAIVAMGVVSRSGLKRFFIGNTAEFVMDAVTADILVVKAADFDSRVPRAGRGVQILSLPDAARLSDAQVACCSMRGSRRIGVDEGHAALRKVFEDVVERENAGEPAAIVDHGHAPHATDPHALQCLFDAGAAPAP